METSNNVKYFYCEEDFLPLVKSDDFKVGLIAEYMRLVQNVDKLRTTLIKLDSSKIELDNYQVELLREQHKAMCAYLNVLQKRLVELNIVIPELCFSIKGLDI